jgi:hypothetical protein
MAAANTGRPDGGGKLDCHVCERVLNAGGATCAAAVATWACVCMRGDMLIVGSALRSRAARPFRTRSSLMESVGGAVVFLVGALLMGTLLDRSGLPDTAVDYEKALEARKLLSASDSRGNRRHSERTMRITAVDYEKVLEARKLLSASDSHGDRRHNERTMQMLTQQCRQQALLAMSA